MPIRFQVATDFRATTPQNAPWHRRTPAALGNLSGGWRFEILARDAFEKAIPVDGVVFFIARQVVLLAYWLSTDRALCFWEDATGHACTILTPCSVQSTSSSLLDSTPLREEAVLNFERLPTGGAEHPSSSFAT
jgi:hypothetical protein